jgi:hypothetical protein
MGTCEPEDEKPASDAPAPPAQNVLEYRDGRKDAPDASDVLKGIVALIQTILLGAMLLGFARTFFNERERAWWMTLVFVIGVLLLLYGVSIGVINAISYFLGRYHRSRF